MVQKHGEVEEKEKTVVSTETREITELARRFADLVLHNGFEKTYGDDIYIETSFYDSDLAEYFRVKIGCDNADKLQVYSELTGEKVLEIQFGNGVQQTNPRYRNYQKHFAEKARELIENNMLKQSLGSILTSGYDIPLLYTVVKYIDLVKTNYIYGYDINNMFTKIRKNILTRRDILRKYLSETESLTNYVERISEYISRERDSDSNNKLFKQPMSFSIGYRYRKDRFTHSQSFSYAFKRQFMFIHENSKIAVSKNYTPSLNFYSEINVANHKFNFADLHISPELLLCRNCSISKIPETYRDRTIKIIEFSESFIREFIESLKRIESRLAQYSTQEDLWKIAIEPDGLKPNKETLTKLSELFQKYRDTAISILLYLPGFTVAINIEPEQKTISYATRYQDIDVVADRYVLDIESNRLRVEREREDFPIPARPVDYYQFYYQAATVTYAAKTALMKTLRKLVECFTEIFRKLE